MIFPNSQQIDMKIIGGTNFSRYPKITDEQTVNFMVTQSNDISVLVPYDGYELIIKFFPDQQPREVYVSSLLNELLAVIGNNVYAINVNLGYRLIGQLSSYEGPVYFAENLEIGRASCRERV